jgi:hypothetical protein
MFDGVSLVRDAAAAQTAAIQDAVARGGGVVRVRALADAGWSRRAIDRALEAAAIIRVRNGWVRTPAADPLLSAAARHGVVLSCVTQARRLGSWVLKDEGVHVAAHSHAGRVGPVAAVVHWSRPLVPRHPDALVDPVDNVLGHDAQLMLLGCHVIRVGYGQMIDRWHEVQDAIMRAVAQGLHLMRD